MSAPALEEKPLPSGQDALKPAFDAKDFRNALGCFCTGVTVITAATESQRAGLTVNSFSSVSLNPPLVLWSLYIHAPSMPVFQEASHFCVNVLNDGQESLARHFAKHAPDKFEGVEWRPGLGGAPLIFGSVARFECRNAQRYYGGDHVIFLGAVEDYTFGDGDPLLFSRGAYRTFAEPTP